MENGYRKTIYMMTMFTFLILIFKCTDLLAVKVLFHFENETVILPCDKLPNRTITWQGPERFKVYGYGNKINPMLSKSKRLSIIHTEGSLHYKLQIRHFAGEDVGLYKCVRGESTEGVHNELFQLTMAKNPSNLTIEKDNSNHTLYGYLYQLMKLRCSVIQGIPEGTLAWMVNNKTLKEGTTSSLVYEFEPKHENHLQEYTCAVRNNIAKHSIMHTVQLFVYLPPIVSISPGKPIEILEGEDLSLFCNYSSNHIIEQLEWKKNLQHNYFESSPHFHIKSVNRSNSGQYSCTVKNKAGTDTDSVIVKVHYPPTVQIHFEEDGIERQLNCVATGIPDQYIYKQWEHRSEYSDLIRYLPDDGSGKLNIPFIDGETDRHHDKGIYICHASNNVSFNGEDSFVRGDFFLNTKGKPYFVTFNNKTQYGVLGQTTNITVDFVSFPDITNISVSVDGMVHSNENYTLEIMQVLDRVYNKTVFVNGSRLMMTVKVNTEKDFTAYTFKLCNQIGSDNLTVFLRSAGCPETPEIIQIMPGNTRVIVQWIPKFNGGFQQSFHIQYRRRDVQYWNTKHIQDHTMNTYSIDGLTPGTKYLIRIYSSNRKGKSSYSDEIPFKTGEYQDATHDNGNLGFILLIVPFVIAVVIVYWQYKKGKLRDLDRISCCKWPSFFDAGGIGAVENNLYENQNNDVHNAVAHNMDMPVYNSIERRAQLSIGQCVSYSATPKRKPNPLGKRKNDIACFGASSGSEKTAEWKCPDELNYIDVCFEPKPSGHKFQIHGSENKTDYVDIDFSKRICSFAESGRTSDDDFSSIDDIRMLKKEQK